MTLFSARGKHKIQEKSLVIWDWNGTLLNDTETCIASMNHMLARRGMPLLTQGRYKELFRFPVQEYYIDLGFNFKRESFELLSVEFISKYRDLQTGADLHAGAVELLDAFRQRKIKQVILSAMERKTLIGDVTARGIEGYFEEILGVDDHYAHGKAGIAADYLISTPFRADEILMLGDTLHDFEVASLLGCACILIAQGHHPFHRLQAAGATVEKNLGDVLNLLINT
jgi:phosphoglycolate phosphatase